MHFIFLTIVFLVTLTALIVVHELGHYWVAKCCGIRVSRFSMGFGKVLWRWRRSPQSTEFVVSLIPFGGYVKLAEATDPDLSDAQRRETFQQQSLRKRVMVVVAGVVFNLIFAWIVYSAVFILGIDYPRPIIGQILPHSPMAEAHFQIGEEILSIDGKPVGNWAVMAMRLIPSIGDTVTLPVVVREHDKTMEQIRQLSLVDWRLHDLQPDFLQSLGIIPYLPQGSLIVRYVAQSSPAAWAGISSGDRFVRWDGKPLTTEYALRQKINTQAGRSINVVLERDGKQFSSVIDIEKQKNWLGREQAYVGLEFFKIAWPDHLLQKQQFSPPMALWVAAKEICDIAQFNSVVIGKMLVGKISLRSLGGPVSLFQGIAVSLRQSFTHYLNFVAFLSTSLAVINLLPIPGLDGGFLIYFLIERLQGRPISPALQTLLIRLGVIFLIVIMFQALANDVLRMLM